MVEKTMTPLYEKLIIRGALQLKTGMHIGSSSDFAPIGAVDSIVVRDAMTKRPMIPGSSLKGKLRYLTARAEAATQLIGRIEDDPESMKRLFGSHSPKPRNSRLQVSDAILTDASTDELNKKGTDLYLSEIKFENTINRITSVANPRQIERVPAGAVFEMNLIYNVESLEELNSDVEMLSRALRLLQTDYLGGHGSRGYGRVALNNIRVERLGLCTTELDMPALEKLLKGAEYSEILPE